MADTIPTPAELDLIRRLEDRHLLLVITTLTQARSVGGLGKAGERGTQRWLAARETLLRLTPFARQAPVYRSRMLPSWSRQARSSAATSRPSGDGLGRVAPMPEGVAVARRRPAPVSPVMHPALPSVPAV